MPMHELKNCAIHGIPRKSGEKAIRGKGRGKKKKEKKKKFDRGLGCGKGTMKRNRLSGEGSSELDDKRSHTTCERDAGSQADPPCPPVDRASEETQEAIVGLTDDQLQAVLKAQEGLSMFITGGAGTGKSFVLRKVVELLAATRRVIVTASTGLAACQYDGGRTLHSLLASEEELVATGLLTVVVDEVSMVNLELFDSLFAAMSRVNGFQDKEWPTALQLICVGDFLQLPPVNGGFAFESRAWERLRLRENTVVLSVSHRQRGDAEFVSLLNRLRIGLCTLADLETLNTGSDAFDDSVVTHLYCKREKVDEENERRFASLTSKKRDYEIRMSLSDGDQKIRNLLKQVLHIEGNYSAEKVVNARDGIFQHSLRLAIGCVIMVTVNVDVAHGVVNGLRGTVRDLSDDEIVISCANGDIKKIKRLSRYWGPEVYVSQFPVRLAWAITVHKSQGLTLEKAVVDVSDAFAFGQVYTALSRFQSLDSVILKSGLHPGKVWAHPKALAYYDRFAGIKHEQSLRDLEINAVSDVVGEPCILKGFLKRKNDNLLLLSCSMAPQSHLNVIAIWDSRKYREGEYFVRVLRFDRSKVSGMFFPKIDRHKFFAYPESIEKVVTGATEYHLVDEKFILGPEDRTLNTRSRVSVRGRVKKVDSSENVILAMDGVDGEIVINFPPTSLSLARPSFSVGQEVTFSNLKSCGSGKPLLMDEVSGLCRVAKVKRDQVQRLVSVSPAVFQLAQSADVFVEVLSCSNDFSGACFSVLSLLSGDRSSFISDDPFLISSEKLEKKIGEFFHSVSDAVKAHRSRPDGHQLVAPEIPHLRLGSGGSIGLKYGVGKRLAERAASELYEALSACERYLKSPNFSSVIQFVLLEIFCEGFGNDMMNDFFAFNMFDAILEFNNGLTKKVGEILKDIGLSAREMSVPQLIESFFDEIRAEDKENWVDWHDKHVGSQNFDETFHIPFDADKGKPILFVPRRMISRRSSALQTHFSTLRNEANDLFRSRLEGKKLEEMTSFFQKVGNLSTISSAQISIVVSNKSVAARVAQDSTMLEGGLYLRKLNIGTKTVCCVIGDLASFLLNRHALKSIVLVFVEPVEMKPYSSFGCHPVGKIHDFKHSVSIPLSVQIRGDGESITLFSNVRSSSRLKMESLQSVPNTWALDRSGDQFGHLCYDNLKDCTWMIWAVNRASDDGSNPANVIFEKLKSLPLRDSAGLDQFLHECCFTSTTDETPDMGTVRIATFNLCHLGTGDKSPKNHDILVNGVIEKNSLSVVALQEVSRPFSDISSDAHRFRSIAQAQRKDGPCLQVFGAHEGTGIGSAVEYPSIVIDERIVEPAGDRTGSTWHGYVEHSSLLFNTVSDEKFPYPRVPYFWRLRVKKNNATFVVVSVHFAPDSHYLSEANRLKCIDLLTHFANDKWPRDDVFIVGDFNIYNVAKFKKDISSSGFKTLLSDDETTNVTRTEPYDHILVRDKERFKEANSAVVIDLAGVVSDALSSTKGIGSHTKLKALKALGSPNSQTFKQGLSDHCPVFFEYIQWKENRLFVKK